MDSIYKESLLKNLVELIKQFNIFKTPTRRIINNNLLNEKKNIFEEMMSAE